jgi:hypothetical protein
MAPMCCVPSQSAARNCRFRPIGLGGIHSRRARVVNGTRRDVHAGDSPPLGDPMSSPAGLGYEPALEPRNAATRRALV